MRQGHLLKSILIIQLEYKTTTISHHCIDVNYTHTHINRLEFCYSLKIFEIETIEFNG